MLRKLQKKWFKFLEKRQRKHYHSHWYLRFGWLNGSFDEMTQCQSLFEIHSPNKMTFADPFYAQHEGRHFIFFEEVDDIHPVGFLSVLEVFEDGQATEPQPILKLDYHLSYPCVFKHNDTWYMIPETSANETIELWKCTDFPMHWVKEKNLVEHIRAVDSTPFFHDGLWYLFTSTRRDCKKFGDRLDIFYTDDLLNGTWQEHPKNPVCRGQVEYRMAGQPFYFKDTLVRPSQNSLKRYGGHIELKEIVQLSPTHYEERLCQEILPNWHEQDAASHTINFQQQFLLLDAVRLTKKS